jgi:hypothetical protein
VRRATVACTQPGPVGAVARRIGESSRRRSIGVIRRPYGPGAVCTIGRSADPAGDRRPPFVAVCSSRSAGVTCVCMLPRVRTLRREPRCRSRRCRREPGWGCAAGSVRSRRRSGISSAGRCQSRARDPSAASRPSLRPLSPRLLARELEHVGVARLLLAPARRHQRVDEHRGGLADVDAQHAAVIGQALVVVEGLANALAGALERLPGVRVVEDGRLEARQPEVGTAGTIDLTQRLGRQALGQPAVGVQQAVLRGACLTGRKRRSALVEVRPPFARLHSRPPNRAPARRILRTRSCR